MAGVGCNAIHFKDELHVLAVKSNGIVGRQHAPGKADTRTHVMDKICDNLPLTCSIAIRLGLLLVRDRSCQREAVWLLDFIPISLQEMLSCPNRSNGSVASPLPAATTLLDDSLQPSFCICSVLALMAGL